ncbi:hypothetical protein Celaphus_00000680, partial [Cervus elaphus hippelaphus]
VSTWTNAKDTGTARQEANVSAMDVALSTHPPRTSENRDLERVQGCQKEWLELVLKAAQEMDPVPRAKNAAALAVENLAKSLGATYGEAESLLAFASPEGTPAAPLL